MARRRGESWRENEGRKAIGEDDCRGLTKGGVLSMGNVKKERGKRRRSLKLDIRVAGKGMEMWGKIRRQNTRKRKEGRKERSQ